MAEELVQQKLELVCNSPIFFQVDEIMVEQIISDRRCQFRRFSKGETINAETKFQHCLGIILTGRVRVDKRMPGERRMKMSTLQPGECFGTPAFHEAGQYAAALTAECDAEILFLPEEVLRWTMRRNFTVTENYIRYLSNQIRFLNEKISELTAGTANQRLAGFLAEHCDVDGCLQSPMTELSGQLNMARATLYRALDALEEQGLIARGSKILRILDMEGLCRVAEKR